MIQNFPESKLSRSIRLSGQLADELARNETAGDVPVVDAAGKENQAPKGGGLATIPAVLSPLHEIEQSLLALLDTEEMVTEEQEQAFLQDLSASMQAAVAKRDRVAGFIKLCEARAEECAMEIQRLSTRKRTFVNAAERVRNYVLWIIEALGPDDKGKLRTLEGDKFTFATRKAKAKLEIIDESLVPIEYKDVTVTLHGPWFIKMAKVLQALQMYPIRDPKWTINEEAVHAAMTDGSPVPGVILVTDRNSVVLR